MQEKLSARNAVLFLLSGSDTGALISKVRNLQTLLKQHGDTELQQLARLHARDGLSSDNFAVVASSADELTERLGQSLPQLHEGGASPRFPSGVYYGKKPAAGKLAFLFPGQGSQFPGMLLQAAEIFPEVRRWLSELDAAYLKAGRPAPSTVLQKTDAPELFDMQVGAQLGLTASLAMTEVLRTLGLVPDCMLGHSNGEHAALVAAGALGHFDPVEACAEFARGSALADRIESPAEPEGMLAVAALRRPAVDRFLTQQDGQIFLAIDNAPLQLVLGGTLHAMEEAEKILRPPIALCSRLSSQRAYHTPLFSGWSTLLDRHLRDLPLRPPAIPVYSGATADLFPAEPETIRRLMSTQWSQTVRFRETIERMYADGVRTFLEVGPDAKLASLVRDILRNREHIVVSISSANQGDWSALLQACGRLFASGRKVKIEVLDQLLPAPHSQRPAPVSSRAGASASAGLAAALYREHQRTMQSIQQSQLRIEARLREFTHPSPANTTAALAGNMVRRDETQSSLSLTLSAASAGPHILDHSMGRRDWGGSPLPVLPFTYTLAVAVDAAHRAHPRGRILLEDIRAHRWLALDKGSLEIRIETAKDHVTIHSSGDGQPSLAFEARLSSISWPLLSRFLPRTDVATSSWTPQRFYRDFAFHGPAFHLLHQVRMHGTQIEAELVCPDGQTISPVDPAVLDCAGQLAAIWLLESGRTEFGAFPFSMEKFQYSGASVSPNDRIVCRGAITPGPFDTTSISLDFLTPGGEVLYQVTGLQQKIVAFPPGVAAALFGKSKDTALSERVEIPTAKAVLCSLPQATIRVLESQQAIWARVIAHSLFSSSQLEHLYRQPLSQRWQSVIAELLKRETTARWLDLGYGEHPEVQVTHTQNGTFAVAYPPGQAVWLQETQPPEQSNRSVLWEGTLQGQALKLCTS